MLCTGSISPPCPRPLQCLRLLFKFALVECPRCCLYCPSRSALADALAECPRCCLPSLSALAVARGVPSLFASRMPLRSALAVACIVAQCPRYCAKGWFLRRYREASNRGKFLYPHKGRMHKRFKNAGSRCHWVEDPQGVDMYRPTGKTARGLEEYICVRGTQTVARESYHAQSNEFLHSHAGGKLQKDIAKKAVFLGNMRWNAMRRQNLPKGMFARTAQYFCNAIAPACYIDTECHRLCGACVI